MDEDKYLLELLKKDDSVAFETLFEKYASRLYHFSLRLFHGSIYDAEEVVQNVFLKIWESRATIDSVKNFNSYLITIAKHQIYDTIKHKFVTQKHRQHILKVSEQSTANEDQSVLQDMVELMLSHIEQLPDQQKEVMLLRNQGFTNAEIAKKLALSIRTVETHVSNALKVLRRYFLNHEAITLLFIGLLFESIES